MLLEHAQHTTKVVGGGAVVAASTYQAVDWVTNATQYATFSAAVATTLYFLVQVGYIAWKWKKEAGDGK